MKNYQFYKILRHVLQKMAFKKPISKYKKMKDYNINDIYQISKIQNEYKSYYSKKHINLNDVVKVYSNKMDINCYITKKNIEKHDKSIILIQRTFKSYLNKNKLEKNNIMKKPLFLFVTQNSLKNKSYNNLDINKVTIEKSNDNNKKMELTNIDNNTISRNINNLQAQSNTYDIMPNENIYSLKDNNINNKYVNYNLLYFITKQCINNVTDELIYLQRVIKSYLILMKAKKEYYSNKNCIYIRNY